MKKYLFFFILIGFILLFSSFIFIKGEKDVYACKNNDECIIVRSDCCGCNNGGSSTSINKRYKEYWEKKKKEMCNTPECVKLFVCPRGMTPQCVNNKCKLQYYTEEEAK
jgi:hypothetical protein